MVYFPLFSSLKVNLWSNDTLYAWLSWNQRQSDEAIINEDLQPENKGFRLHNKSQNYDSTNNYVEIKLQMTLSKSTQTAVVSLWLLQNGSHEMSHAELEK